MKLYELQHIWYNKLNDDQRFEIIRDTIWEGLTPDEANREQGDSIADMATELNDKGLFEILHHFNGQATGREIPSPLLIYFLERVTDEHDNKK